MHAELHLPTKFVVLTVIAFFTATAHGNTILNSWAGMVNLTDLSPPDPHGAAGPSGILQTVNTAIAYYNKSGTIVWGPMLLQNFWESVTNTGQGNSDPKVIYDHESGRFYVIMQENLAMAPFRSFLNLAVSKTANPTESGTDQWFFFRVDMTEEDVQENLGGDYPGFGVDTQALYVTYNMFKLDSSGPSGPIFNTQILIINKADIKRGVLSVTKRFTAPGSGGTLVPASVSGSANPGNRAFFVQVGFPTALALWSLEDPLGSATLLPPLALPVLPNGDFPNGGAPQRGTSIQLDTLGEELKAQGNAFWRDGAIWFCYTGGVLFEERTRVYYYRIDTGALPTVAEEGYIDGGDDVWTFQPALGVNTCGDICMVYCESSATEFPRIMCSVRPRGASQFAPPFLVKESPSFYAESTSPARWGDYASVTEDPTDGTFWITHEWAPSSTQTDWGTWWAQISVTPPPSRDIYVNNAADPLLGCCRFPDGSRDCGLFSGPYCTVAAGVDSAFCGDTLKIAQGSYKDRLTVSKTLQLQAYDGMVIIGK